MEYIVRTNMESSVIDSIVYNPHQRDLLVTMKGGGKYVYRKVPVDVAVGFATAQSPGKFYSANVRRTFLCDRG